MKHWKLAHVGIAVADVESARAQLEPLFGPFEPVEEVASQKVRVAFAPGAGVEIVQADGDTSPLYPMLEHPISSFLRRRGPGLHHVCYQVPDLDGALEQLREAGIRPLSESPLTGAKGARVAFLNPRDCQGILVELCENDHDDHGDRP